MAEIAVIGGINIDIEGAPYEKLIYADSNPGNVRMSYGGVGRNITENIARLGGDVAMISLAGNDHMGRGAKDALKKIGVDVEEIHLLDNFSTAMYLSILNDSNDMELAICNMEILQEITPEFLGGTMDKLSQASIVACDTNLESHILKYITETLSEKTLFLDAVSVTKAERAKEVIGYFDIIKPNRLEAEILAGMNISTDEDVKAAGRYFIHKGVKKVFITLGSQGVYYTDGNIEGFLRPQKVDIVSATGAGDAFSAAIIVGESLGLDIEKTAEMGMAASAMAMKTRSAVNENISMEELKCLKSI